MAAHKLTGMKQVAKLLHQSGSELAADYLTMSGALELSCWTEDLGLDQFCWLTSWVDSVNEGKEGLSKRTFNEEFVKLNAKLAAWISEAFKEWAALGEPETREDWNKQRREQCSAT